MTTRVYLVTEGVHDVAFVGKLLRVAFGLRRIETREDLDPAWQKFLTNFKWPLPPRKRDGKTDIARLSVPAPFFYGDSDTSVAISNAQGIDNIIHRATADLEGLERADTELQAVGFFLDSDDKPPQKRFDEFAPQIESLGLPRPAALGVVEGTPRIGIFSMPDSTALGTLEDLLIPCARTAYPELFREAAALVERRDAFLGGLKGKEKADICSPAGPKKATAAIVGAFLKPGKPIQASIEDHRWICPETLALSELSGLLAFVKVLLTGSLQNK